MDAEGISRRNLKLSGFIGILNRGDDIVAKAKCLNISRSASIHCAFFLVVCAMNANHVSAQTTLWSIRAGVTVGPENTIEGMQTAFDLGAGGTEIDLWNTAPDPVSGEMEIILMHDREVDRTTDGTGQVQNLSFEYLRSLDAGSYVHPNGNGVAFPGAKIPTLQESLNFINDRGKDVLIHIKRDLFGLGGEVAISDVAEVVSEVEFSEDDLFTWTYHKEEAAAFSELIPEIQVIFQGGQDRNDIDFEELRDLGVSGIQVFTNSQGGAGQFSQSYIDEIHANGFFAFVNYPSLGELDLALEWDVEYVQHFKVEQYATIVDAFNANAVPEPGTAALLGSLLCLGGMIRRRKAS
jgi:glycerophosphoryl diester phosphodiesterase